ncbi:flavodoxin family protein [Dethiosulfatarculus sandiegensis]|uniref:NADPH-dependent FMN reductase n=1 Tax=Dethiosulfatarculus sandiegensis TaxID=1429043 RepID=A0A0D2GKI2_9BACT|nr:flavodoxin family protein [Dethiosulfatarculus sandiegensis]KIX15272.1 NADPH-dependent FMN reductase [Dethiosulfatarculus sandiegensis]
MNVLGISTSPRKKGNTHFLLTQALSAAEEAGANTDLISCRKLKISGCLECGGCDKTGLCVVKDEMQEVYPKLEWADAIILAAPIFFYSIPAQGKALIDRSQAPWSRRRLNKKGAELKQFDSGKGYFLGAGASRGKNLFLGAELVAQYFFDALDMSYEGALNFRGLEKNTDAVTSDDLINQARELGLKAARGQNFS